MREADYVFVTNGSIIETTDSRKIVDGNQAAEDCCDENQEGESQQFNSPKLLSSREVTV